MYENMKGGESSPVAAILLRMKQDAKGGAPVPGKDAAADPGSINEPEGDMVNSTPEGDLEMAAEDLSSAVASGEAPAIAAAFQAMFDICQSQIKSYEDDDLPSDDEV